MATQNLDAACTIVATDKLDKECNWLSEYRTDVFSQSGEDGIIEKIFDVIGTKINGLLNLALATVSLYLIQEILF